MLRKHLLWLTCMALLVCVSSSLADPLVHLTLDVNDIVAVDPNDPNSVMVAVDVTGNGYDAELAGQTEVAGVLGEALSFDGSGYVHVVDSNTLPINNVDSTLMFWFKSGVDANTPIPMLSHAQADGAHLAQGRVIGLNAIHPTKGWAKPGQILIDHAMVSDIESDPNVNLSDGEWHHAAYTQVFSSDPNGDYEDIVLYVDGAVDAEKQWAMTGQSWQLGGTPETYVVRLGGFTQQILWGDNMFTGCLDDVKVFGKTLTAPQVSAAGGFAVDVWSDDFEGAVAGPNTLPTNTTIDGTDIQLANVLTGVVIDLDDPCNADLAAAFPSGCGNVLQVNYGGNAWGALRAPANLTFDAVDVNDSYTCSYDLYIPADVTNPIGRFNPRTPGGGTYESEAVSAAGVYHVVYTGTVADLTAGVDEVSTARPFIVMAPEEAGVSLEAFCYIDNISFIMGG